MRRAGGWYDTHGASKAQENWVDRIEGATRAKSYGGTEVNLERGGRSGRGIM